MHKKLSEKTSWLPLSYNEQKSNEKKTASLSKNKNYETPKLNSWVIYILILMTK